MTEAHKLAAEWIACSDPQRMLTLLSGRASDRKLRLFACAYARRLRSLLKSRRHLVTLELAEKYADGEAAPEEVRGSYRRIWQRSFGGPKDIPVWTAFLSVWQLSIREAMRTSQEAAGLAGEMGSLEGEAPARAAILRELFGNPFCTTAVETAWLAWNDGAVRKMARSIYNARAFDRLPLLADALEDAGCTDIDILGHCRTPGEHVRGCWVIDLLLGKS